MKLFFIVVILSFPVFLNGDEYFTPGRAETLKKGRFEVGVFQPLRYGFRDDIEVSTYPLMNFIMPNFSVKKKYFQTSKMVFSSEHFISYPTLILKTISKRGIGGLLPETRKENIPHQIYTEHSVIFTYRFSKYFIMTPRISISLPLIFDNKKFSDIDMFLLYTRTASFHGNLIYTLSLDLEGKIYKKLYYCIDFDFYNDLGISFYDYADGIAANYEHKFYLQWKQSKKVSYLIGYKMVFGDYPYGKQFNILPLFDISFGF